LAASRAFVLPCFAQLDVQRAGQCHTPRTTVNDICGLKGPGLPTARSAKSSPSPTLTEPDTCAADPRRWR
jgi:hypothetical protein